MGELLNVWNGIEMAGNVFYPLFCRVADFGFRTAPAVLVIIVLRQSLLKKMPGKICCWLWFLLFLRLLLPVSVESPWDFPHMESPLTLAEDIQENEPARQYSAGVSGEAEKGRLNTGIKESTPDMEDTISGAGRQSPGRNIPAAAEIPTLKNIAKSLTVIWLFGTFVLLISILLRGFLLKARLRTAASKPGTGGTVRISGRIAGPFVLGIFRPVIYLPAGLSGEEEEMILAHERAHVKRKDPLIKLACFAAAAIHWFNPLVWISFRLMTRDMEMACDEQALADAGKDIRIAYSRALLSVSVKGNGLLPVSFGESDTKRRVKNVLYGTRMTKAKWITTFAVLFALGTALLLSGIRNNNSDGADPLPAAAETEAAEKTPQEENQEKENQTQENQGQENDAASEDSERQSLTTQKEELQKEIAQVSAEIEDWTLQMNAIFEQMENASEDEKESWMSRYNEKAEGQQALYERLNRLKSKQQEVKNQLLELDIIEITGRNLILEERKRLEALPEDLNAANASEYGIYVAAVNGSDEITRQSLWNFYENTGFGKGTLPEPYKLEPLETQEFTGITNEVVSRRVVAETILIGQLTEEGDMVLISVKCWGKGYLILTDRSRDKWKETGVEDITVSHAGYLNWLRDEKTGMENVVASDRGGLTFEQLMESMLSSKMEDLIPHIFLAWFE